MKYIYILIVLEFNNVCREFEGELEECWKIKKKDKFVMFYI